MPPVDASYVQSPYYQPSSGMPEHGMNNPGIIPDLGMSLWLKKSNNKNNIYL
jgi:hypothetical protein